MTAEAPPFWWRQHDWRAYLLYPVSAVYGAVARSRMDMARPPEAGIPVLCIGNLTVGGAGKTPMAIAMAKAARKLGHKPGFLTRGHGRGLTHPRLADPKSDTAWHSGDEALLLAANAPTAVATNRKAGVELLIGEGCDFAIMDDGFQSVRLRYDFALIVVDAHRGIGNGHVIPGGPLRAPLKAQIRRASAIVTMGQGNAADPIIRQASRAGKPVHSADVRVINPRKFAGRRFFAFAGIGNPQKFFDTLEACGGQVVAVREFGDHHAYSDPEITEMARAAGNASLELITTEKDAARFVNGNTAATKFLSMLDVLKIDAEFDPPELAERIVTETVENFRLRRFSA
ncbi:MAG: tetraacyldisaccharide 4'-kinase [Rhizobiaceae bacterium]